MQNDAIERLKSLLTALQREAEGLLSQHKLWDVSAFGWKNADAPDDEYGGIALWEMNPPFEHDWGTLLEGKQAKYAPDKRDEVLLSSGEDLIATMMFARRSLGMALCYSAVARPDVVGENDEFWQEYATTLMWLNIASDRLRDFFVMARFGQTRDQYHTKYRNDHDPKDHRVPYSAPFKESTGDVPSDLRKYLEELSQLASDVQANRHERVERVHKVATMSAQRSIELLHEQRRLAGKSEKKTRPHDETTAPAIDAMKSWFLQMIKATSLVFDFEYFNRIKAHRR